MIQNCPVCNGPRHGKEPCKVFQRTGWSAPSTAEQDCLTFARICRALLKKQQVPTATVVQLCAKYPERTVR